MTFSVCPTATRVEPLSPIAQEATATPAQVGEGTPRPKVRKYYHPSPSLLESAHSRSPLAADICIEEVATFGRERAITLPGTGDYPTTVSGGHGRVRIRLPEYRGTGTSVIDCLLPPSGETTTPIDLSIGSITFKNAYMTSVTWAAETAFAEIDFTSTSTNATTSWVNLNFDGFTSLPDAKALVRGAIRSNLLIRTRSRQDYLQPQASPAEVKARRTLRDMLSEKEWRRYVTNGFIMARGESGKWYQIFRDQRTLQVYENGKLLSKICIHTDRQCPPTDHVINMKILVEMDEEQVWRGGNVRGTNLQYRWEEDSSERNGHQNLVDLYQKFKDPQALLYA